MARVTESPETAAFGCEIRAQSAWLPPQPGAAITAEATNQPSPIMTRLLLTVSAAVMAGSLGCIGVALDEAINDRDRLTDAQLGHLVAAGFIGAHLAAVPTIAADRLA